MGYTVYYQSNNNLPSKRQTSDINTILKVYYQNGIITGDPLGTKKVSPKVKENKVILNGLTPNEYETFVVHFGCPNSTDWFCKTNRLPYTEPILVLLSYLKASNLITSWSTD